MRRRGGVRVLRLKGVAPGRSKYGAEKCWVDPERRTLCAHQALILQHIAKGLEVDAARKAALLEGKARGWVLCDSTLEATRYRELLTLQAQGGIDGLAHQVRFGLHAGSVLVGHYIADFVYRHDGQMVVEDAKGKSTELYRWKKKHFEAEHGVTIREIRAGSSTRLTDTPKT